MLVSRKHDKYADPRCSDKSKTAEHDSEYHKYRLRRSILCHDHLHTRRNGGGNRRLYRGFKQRNVKLDYVFSRIILCKALAHTDNGNVHSDNQCIYGIFHVVGGYKLICNTIIFVVIKSYKLFYAKTFSFGNLGGCGENSFYGVKYRGITCFVFYFNLSIHTVGILKTNIGRRHLKIITEISRHFIDKGRNVSVSSVEVILIIKFVIAKICSVDNVSVFHIRYVCIFLNACEREACYQCKKSKNTDNNSLYHRPFFSPLLVQISELFFQFRQL